MNIVEVVIFYTTKVLSMRNRIKFVKFFNTLRFSSRLKYRSHLYQQKNREGKNLYAVNSQIRMEDGYALDLSQSLPYVTAAIADAKDILSRDVKVTAFSNKVFLTNHLTEDDLSNYRSFINMATSDAMLTIVADYLGFIPVLSEIALWYSAASDHKIPESSQLYHLDNADTSQVKIFILLDDVDDNGGPFTFLGSRDSERVLDKTNYGNKRDVERLHDNVVYDIVSSRNAVKFSFNAGSMAFVDTSKCLHFGSRCLDRSRRVIMLQYLSPCRADFRKNNLSKFIRNNDTDLRKLVLDPDTVSVEH